MQVIGLMGYVDKYDFTINLAKAINIVGKSVLVIDATLDKKIKYVIPSMSVEKAYVTQYNNIDFAVGFESIHEIENYMSERGINIGLYDYAIIDIDSPKAYEFFRARGFDKLYFFVDSTVLSVEKNKEIANSFKIFNNASEQKIKMTRVLYKTYMSRASEKYFSDSLTEYGIEWNENFYEIPNEDQDKMANMDSQLSGIIDIRKHTKYFVNAIADMTAEIVENINARQVISEIKRRRD
ncbi:predicted protein [Clostridium sp. CAG:1219]|nr:predicted protein [Clostridium sp. CAG:1219]